MRDCDRFRGCLIGGAAGDALGYAVEFTREGEIFRRYGERGITEYELRGGKALFSDDTQMTLFTANGLLAAATRGRVRGEAPEYSGQIAKSYRDWLRTQETRWPIPGGPECAWLANVPGLFARRAPGITCCGAIRSGESGTPEKPINGSKGCGGVMRVAPIGLYFNDRGADVKDVARIGAEAAALTHGHTLGWMPAAALAQIVHEIAEDGAGTAEAVRHSVRTAEEMWPDTPERHDFSDLMEKALALSAGRMDDLDAIHELGEGWVGEEALAIAAFCAARYEEDIDAALIAAVNHGGDSDSTGAIAGNIVGARVGLSGIPPKYTGDLELLDVILEIADDLWRDCPACEGGEIADPDWKAKYVTRTYGEERS